MEHWSRTTEEGCYSGEELLGLFKVTAPMGPFCAGSDREGIILDAQSNPVMTFTSQVSYGNPTAYAKTEVFR